jgi:signal transduction histidine kinase
MDKKAGPTDVSIRREQTTMMKARIDTDDDGINWRYSEKKKTGSHIGLEEN